MTTPVRIGIVGCGDVFGAYAPVVRRLAGHGRATATVVCGRAHQRARAEAVGPARFVTEIDEVVNAHDVDAVVILLPMLEHAKVTRQALSAGKHVLCEKPVATTVAEAQELAALARAQGRMLVAAPFTTLSPTFAAISARLQSGAIGRVVSARGRYGWSGPSWSSWFYKTGGGALFDLAVYNVTTLTGWLGPVRRVAAFSGTAQPVRDVGGVPTTVDVEDNAQILCEFVSGGFAALTTGFTMQQQRSPAIELFGTDGTLQLLGDDWDPDGYELFQRSVGAWQVHKETAPTWSWTSGLDHVVDCIATNKAPQLSIEQAIHVIDALTAAQTAAHTGIAQTLTTTFAPIAKSRASNEAAHLVHDRTREAH